MRRPHGAAVEGLQGGAATGHVAEATEPDEHVGPVEIDELAEEEHACLLLGLDELGIEQGDERVLVTGRNVYWRSSYTEQRRTDVIGET